MFMEVKNIGEYSWNEIQNMDDSIYKEELKKEFLR